MGPGSGPSVHSHKSLGTARPLHWQCGDRSHPDHGSPRPAERPPVCQSFSYGLSTVGSGLEPAAPAHLPGHRELLLPCPLPAAPLSARGGCGWEHPCWWHCSERTSGCRAVTARDARLNDTPAQPPGETRLLSAGDSGRQRTCQVPRRTTQGTSRHPPVHSEQLCGVRRRPLTSGRRPTGQRGSPARASRGWAERGTAPASLEPALGPRPRGRHAWPRSLSLTPQPLRDAPPACPAPPPCGRNTRTGRAVPATPPLHGFPTRTHEATRAARAPRAPPRHALALLGGRERGWRGRCSSASCAGPGAGMRGARLLASRPLRRETRKGVTSSADM